MADIDKALVDLAPCRGVPFHRGKTRWKRQEVHLDATAAKNILACVERGQMFEERFNRLDEIKLKIPSSMGYKAMFVERR